ncbi:hypothetical protein AAGS61_01625 [Lysinibacillus sp. KU-BSD001]|uniref:hypothetical protein n=1 Tax=Lysinibacillus sp. KU-BSD001 TaxID=3141328 RepID=UPI0036F049B5
MTLMTLKKFTVDSIAEKGNCHVIQIKPFGIELVDNSSRVYNMRPFEMVVDERGIIHNYSDQIRVSVDNSAQRTITVDTMNILTLAHHPDVQKEIDRLLGVHQESEDEKLERWDAMLQDVNQVIEQASSAVRDIHIEMLFSDLLEMHRQHAIDIALTNRDEVTFYQLTRVGEQL